MSPWIASPPPPPPARSSSATISESGLHRHGFEDMAPHDRNSLMRLIKSCGTLKNPSLARALLSRSKHLIPRDTYFTVSVLSMLAKCGAMREAVEVFDQIPARTVVPWNSLISALVQNGQPELAIDRFVQMQDEGVAPDAITLTCILKACASMGSLERGAQIHALIDENGWLQQDLLLGNSLVSMYCKLGLLGKAHEILRQLPRRNAASWSPLLSGYVHHGYGGEALRCFRAMQREGISPDSVSFICILRACGSLGCVEAGEEIHGEVAKQGLLEKDVILGTALVDMYAKCGALGKAREALLALPGRNVVTWSALIAGYVQHGHDDAALQCYMEMRDEGIPPDAVAFISVLVACGGVGSLNTGSSIHSEVKGRGLLATDMALGTTLLNMYAKCGALDMAREVFRLLPHRDIAAWNALMDGHAQMGEARSVFEIFRQIGPRGVMADSVSFLILLNACSHSGLLYEGQQVFEGIGSNALICGPSSMEHYTCMVDLFGRAGRLDRVGQLLDSAPSQAYPPLLDAVLGVCRKWANIELGRWALEKLIESGANCAAALACMRNIYSAADCHASEQHLAVGTLGGAVKNPLGWGCE